MTFRRKNVLGLSAASIAAALLSLAATSHAATINVVPGPANAISSAVATANAGDVIIVADGTYTESTQIIINVANLTLQAENDGMATIDYTPAQSTSAFTAIRIRNAGATIQGFNINLASSEAGIAISAYNGDINTGVTNLNNLTIKNNNIQITHANAGIVSGTGINTLACPAPLNFATLKTTSTTAQPGHCVGININSQSSFKIDNVTVSGNTVGSDAVPFGVCMHLERGTGTIGGATPADGNTFVGEDIAFHTRFTSGTFPQTITIKNNIIRGWGDENNRSHLVEVGGSGSGSLIYVENNTFTALSGNSPRLNKIHTSLLGSKNPVSSREQLFIRNNTFNVRNIGVHQAGCVGATIQGNTFNFLNGNAVAIVVSNKVKSSSNTTVDSTRLFNRHRIYGNTFNSSGQTNVNGIEFWDHTQTNNANSNKIRVVENMVGGLGSLANTFDAGLTYFIKLDDFSGSTNTDPRYSSPAGDPTGSAGTSFNSTAIPFPYDVLASNNLYDVGTGAKRPADMNASEKLALAAKIHDKADNSLLGTVYSDLSGTDTDGDGIPDSIETTLGTDASKRDTDADGMEDKMEIFLGNSPTVYTVYTDVDKDGLPFTTDQGFITSNANSDSNPDFDGDGFADGYERIHESDPYDSTSFPPLGDVNGNSITDNNDASVIFNYYLGNIAAPAFLSRADVNRSGAVDYVDAVILFNWSLAPTRRVTSLPLN